MKFDDVTLIDHTITLDDDTIVAGFLVRDRASTKPMGYIWTAGGVWQWESETGNHYGERQTKRAAVETLRDGWRVAQGIDIAGSRRDRGILASWRAATASQVPHVSHEAPVDEDRTSAKPAAPAYAPVPVRQVIVWGADAPDLTAAVKRALGSK